MASLKVGDSWPSDVVFSYVPYQEGSEITACGIPINYDASKGLSPSPALLSPYPQSPLPLLPPSSLPTSPTSQPSPHLHTNQR